MPASNYIKDSVLSDSYTTMMGVYNQGEIIPEFNTVFSDKYKDSENYTNSSGDEVMLSTVASFRGIAKDTARDDTGKHELLPGFVDKIYKLPNHNQESIITADMLQKRLVGHNPFLSNGKSPHTMSDALTYFLSLYMKKHVSQIFGVLEYMALQAIVTGKLTFENNQDIDFGLAPSRNKIISPTWNNATADPIADLDNMMRLIEEESGEKDFEIWIGREAFTAFINNEKVREYYKVFGSGFSNPIFPNTNRDSANTQRLPSIVGPSGLTMEVHCYQEFYDSLVDGNKTANNFFPTDKALILGKNAPLYKAKGFPSVMAQPINTSFGSIEVPMFIANGGSIVQTILPLEDKGIMLRTRSCQAPIVTSTDRIGVLTVV